MLPLPSFTRLFWLPSTVVCSMRILPNPWSIAVTELCRCDRMRVAATDDVPDVLSSVAALDRVESRMWKMTPDVPDAARLIAVFPAKLSCERTRSMLRVASAPADAVMPPFVRCSNVESVIFS